MPMGPSGAEVNMPSRSLVKHVDHSIDPHPEPSQSSPSRLSRSPEIHQTSLATTAAAVMPQTP